MEINKVQWRMIAKGEKLPCDSFLMRKDGTMTSMVTGAGVTVGQDAYYLPVEELRSFPKEESEDERIRKELIAEVKEKIDCIPVPDCRDKEDEKALKQLNKWLAWLEKQAEKKPDDKVEPKFKVGDWFIKNDGSHINKDYDTCKISKVGNGYYTIESIYGYTGKITFETFDTNYHLWTIQDAKDGDVLADGNLPFIFKKVDSMMHSYAYCGISVDDGFKIESDGELGEWTWMQDIKPATKEQRDALLKAMTDAGYTFDFEKKKLKKVEQKSAEWSEDELKVLNEIIEDYEKANKSFSGYQARINWLKSLKDRVQPQPKQEWSEEDEYHKRQILRILKDNGCSQTLQEKTEKWIEERTKSLRPQSHWKPSKEQISVLEFVMEDIEKDSIRYAILNSVLEQLKKLREE